MRVRHQGDGGPPIRVLRIIDRLNVGGPALHAVLVSAGLDPSRFQTLLVHGDIEPSEGDMAYLLALDGNLDSEKFAAVALEIESRGPASVYLGECLEVTARDLPNLLEKDDLESEALCWAA